MSFKETISRLRAAGVPDSPIPAVMEMMDEREEAARREPKLRRALSPEETRNGVSASEWFTLRASVFERDGFACVYCGSDGDGRELHADHVFPRSRGGASALDNLAAACWRCNLSKGGRTPEEWRAAQ